MPPSTNAIAKMPKSCGDKIRIKTRLRTKWMPLCSPSPPSESRKLRPSRTISRGMRLIIRERGCWRRVGAVRLKTGAHDGLKLPGDGGSRECGFESRARRRSISAPYIGHRHNCHDGARERMRVIRRHDPPGGAVLHDLRQAAEPRHERRAAIRHRFNGNTAERLRQARGYRNDVGPAVE